MGRFPEGSFNRSVCNYICNKGKSTDFSKRIPGRTVCGSSADDFYTYVSQESQYQTRQCKLGGRPEDDIETRSAKETYDLGKKIGSHAKAGEVYTLVGDLGVGKTVFTQGLAKGLGIEEPISSPTFTIVQVYDDGRLPFYHFDVYRIGDIEEMDEIGFEDYVYGDGVSLIEWANLIDEILPANRTEITIEKDLEQGFDFRRITVEKRGE